MSDEIREKKYKFESSIKLPDMKEILDAASDFTPPSDKPVEVAATPEPEKEKKSVLELAHKVNLSPEQQELQRLGMAVADAEVRKAQEKERQRAEELRRLRQEREELAAKKAEEEQKIADEEKKKAIQAAKDKAQARKDAETAAAEEARLASTPEHDDSLSIEEQIENMPTGGLKPPSFVTKMPPIEKKKEEVPEEKTVAETQQKPASDEDSMVDISEVAVNPFIENAMKYRPIKPKEAFKETILEDDYKEKMDLKEDSSESVDDSFLDF